MQLRCAFGIASKTFSYSLHLCCFKYMVVLRKCTRVSKLHCMVHFDVRNVGYQQPQTVVKMPCLLSGEKILPNFALEIDFS